MICPGCFKEKEDVVVCPYCWYDDSLRRSPILLPHRTVLNGQYMVGKILGKPGGFGITYLGWDIQLETLIAIKEYLPRDLAGRDYDQTTIAAHSAEEGELFQYGLEQFLQEARTMARIDHMNVVRIRNFFKENGTAYLVMDYYEGVPLSEYLLQKGGKIPEKIAVDIMLPILDGLREIHQRGYLHRDIKPANIYLSVEGRPILLDLGAARNAMGERQRSISVVLTPGFAPYEQYHRHGEQGAWTDIYACGATLYHMISGLNPPDAAERMVSDQLVALSQVNPEVTANVNSAVMKALALEPQYRQQSVQEFIGMIFDVSVPVDAVSGQSEQNRPEEVSENAVMPPPLPDLTNVAVEKTPVVEMNTVMDMKPVVIEDSIPISQVTPEKVKSSPDKKMLMGIAVAVVLLGFGIYSFSQKAQKDKVIANQQIQKQTQAANIAEQAKFKSEKKNRYEKLKGLQDECMDIAYAYEDAKVPGSAEATASNFRDVQYRAKQSKDKLPQIQDPDSVKIISLQKEALGFIAEAGGIFADYIQGIRILGGGNPNWVSVAGETYEAGLKKLGEAADLIEKIK